MFVLLSFNFTVVVFDVLQWKQTQRVCILKANATMKSSNVTNKIAAFWILHCHLQWNGFVWPSMWKALLHWNHVYYSNYNTVNVLYVFVLNQQLKLILLNYFHVCFQTSASKMIRGNEVVLLWISFIFFST